MPVKRGRGRAGRQGFDEAPNCVSPPVSDSSAAAYAPSLASMRAVPFGISGMSVFHADLRLDTRAEGVLDQFHFGHQIGQLDQVVVGVAAGQDDMGHGRLFIA